MGNTLSTYNTIEMNYRQTEANYNADKALNESQMYLTIDRANSSIDETVRQGFWAKYDIQEKEDPIISKLAIHRGEGITAGNSEAREVRTFIGKESRDVANVDSKVTAQAANIWDKAQNQVNSLYLKTYNQYQLANANMFTKDESSLMMSNAWLQDGTQSAAAIGGM